MGYRTVRKQAQDAILATLKQYEKLHFGELENYVVSKDHLDICSERIFREELENLVQKKVVIKHVIARNNTLYTLNSEVSAISDIEVNEMLESIEGIKEATDELLTSILSDASELTKTEEIMKYLKWIVMYEIQLQMLSRASGKQKLTKASKEITSCKKQIIDAITDKGSSSFSLLGGLVYSRLFLEYLNSDPDMFNQFVTDFKQIAENETKKIRKQTKK